MEVLLERCAGLDVHQASVVCCVLIGVPGRKPQKLLRTFGTTTRELEALRTARGTRTEIRLQLGCGAPKPHPA